MIYDYSSSSGVYGKQIITSYLDTSKYAGLLNLKVYFLQSTNREGLISQWLSGDGLGGLHYNSIGLTHGDDLEMSSISGISWPVKMYDTIAVLKFVNTDDADVYHVPTRAIPSLTATSPYYVSGSTKIYNYYTLQSSDVIPYEGYTSGNIELFSPSLPMSLFLDDVSGSAVDTAISWTIGNLLIKKIIRNNNFYRVYTPSDFIQSTVNSNIGYMTLSLSVSGSLGPKIVKMIPSYTNKEVLSCNDNTLTEYKTISGTIDWDTGDWSVTTWGDIGMLSSSNVTGAYVEIATITSVDFDKTKPTSQTFTLSATKPLYLYSIEFNYSKSGRSGVGFTVEWDAYALTDTSVASALIVTPVMQDIYQSTTMELTDDSKYRLVELTKQYCNLYDSNGISFSPNEWLDGTNSPFTIEADGDFFENVTFNLQISSINGKVHEHLFTASPNYTFASLSLYSISASLDNNVRLYSVLSNIPLNSTDKIVFNISPTNNNLYLTDVNKVPIPWNTPMVYNTVSSISAVDIGIGIYNITLSAGSLEGTHEIKSLDNLYNYNFVIDYTDLYESIIESDNYTISAYFETFDKKKKYRLPSSSKIYWNVRSSTSACSVTALNRTSERVLLNTYLDSFNNDILELKLKANDYSDDGLKTIKLTIDAYCDLGVYSDKIQIETPLFPNPEYFNANFNVLSGDVLVFNSVSTENFALSTGNVYTFDITLGNLPYSYILQDVEWNINGNWYQGVSALTSVTVSSNFTVGLSVNNFSWDNYSWCFVSTSNFKFTPFNLDFIVFPTNMFYGNNHKVLTWDNYTESIGTSAYNWGHTEIFNISATPGFDKYVFQIGDDPPIEQNSYFLTSATDCRISIPYKNKNEFLENHIVGVSAYDYSISTNVPFVLTTGNAPATTLRQSIKFVDFDYFENISSIDKSVFDLNNENGGLFTLNLDFYPELYLELPFSNIETNWVVASHIYESDNSLSAGIAPSGVDIAPYLQNGPTSIIISGGNVSALPVVNSIIRFPNQSYLGLDNINLPKWVSTTNDYVIVESISALGGDVYQLDVNTGEWSSFSNGIDISSDRILVSPLASSTFFSLTSESNIYQFHEFKTVSSNVYLKNVPDYISSYIGKSIVLYGNGEEWEYGVKIKLPGDWTIDKNGNFSGTYTPLVSAGTLPYPSNPGSDVINIGLYPDGLWSTFYNLLSSSVHHLGIYGGGIDIWSLTQDEIDSGLIPTLHEHTADTLVTAIKNIINNDPYIGFNTLALTPIDEIEWQYYNSKEFYILFKDNYLYNSSYWGGPYGVPGADSYQANWLGFSIGIIPYSGRYWHYISRINDNSNWVNPIVTGLNTNLIEYRPVNNLGNAYKATETYDTLTATILSYSTETGWNYFTQSNTTLKTIQVDLTLAEISGFEPTGDYSFLDATINRLKIEVDDNNFNINDVVSISGSEVYPDLYTIIAIEGDQLTLNVNEISSVTGILIKDAVYSIPDYSTNIEGQWLSYNKSPIYPDFSPSTGVPIISAGAKLYFTNKMWYNIGWQLLSTETSNNYSLYFNGALGYSWPVPLNVTDNSLITYILSTSEGMSFANEYINKNNSIRYKEITLNKFDFLRIKENTFNTFNLGISANLAINHLFLKDTNAKRQDTNTLFFPITAFHGPSLNISVSSNCVSADEIIVFKNTTPYVGFDGAARFSGPFTFDDGNDNIQVVTATDIPLTGYYTFEGSYSPILSAYKDGRLITKTFPNFIRVGCGTDCIEYDEDIDRSYPDNLILPWQLNDILLKPNEGFTSVQINSAFEMILEDLDYLNQKSKMYSKVAPSDLFNSIFYEDIGLEVIDFKIRGNLHYYLYRNNVGKYKFKVIDITNIEEYSLPDSQRITVLTDTSYYTEGEEFKEPIAMDVSDDGNRVIIVDKSIKSIFIFYYHKTSGKLELKVYWGGPSMKSRSSKTKLNEPLSVIFDTESNIYIADAKSYTVKKYNKYYNWLMNVEHENFLKNKIEPMSIETDLEDNLFVLCNDNYVYKFNSDGIFELKFQVKPGNFKLFVNKSQGDIIYIYNEQSIYKYIKNGILINKFQRPNINNDRIVGIDQNNSTLYIHTNDYIYHAFDCLEVKNLREDDIDNEMWNKHSIFIHKNEFIQDWNYNDSFIKLYQNIDLFKRSLIYKFVLYENPIDSDIIEFDLINLNSSDFISCPLTSTLGINEFVTYDVFNRELTNLYNCLHSGLLMIESGKQKDFTCDINELDWRWDKLTTNSSYFQAECNVKTPISWEELSFHGITSWYELTSVNKEPSVYELNNYVISGIGNLVSKTIDDCNGGQCR